MLIGVTLTFPVTFLLTFAVGYAIWGDSELAVSLVLSAVRTVHGVRPHVLLVAGAEILQMQHPYHLETGDNPVLSPVARRIVRRPSSRHLSGVCAEPAKKEADGLRARPHAPPGMAPRLSRDVGQIGLRGGRHVEHAERVRHHSV